MENAGEQGGSQESAGTATSTAASSSVPAFGHAPFGGSVRTRVEGSGRLTLPAAYRSAFDGTARVRAHKDQFLMIWTERVFHAIADRYAQQEQGLINPRGRKLLFMSTQQVVIDRQGRFVVPPDLRDAIGLTDDVVVAGSIETLEVWPDHRWRTDVEPELDGSDLFFETFDGLPLDPS